MQQRTVDSLRDWFRQCPYIERNVFFGVDNLGNNPTEYAIYLTPSNLMTATDITGETYVKTVQELAFSFTSREKHPSDVLQALASHGFYSDVIEWIVEQNKKKNFPKIEEGTVTSIMPSQTQYLFEAGASTGRYQIPCKMKYRRNV